MKWKTKFLFILLLSFPAFTDYPISRVNAEIIPGITYGWVIYFALVNISIAFITGGHFFSNAITVSALISMPVVFMGGTLSYLFLIFGWTHESNQSIYSAHYVKLCITMLTVIPLALSMVAIVPFHDFEARLLKNANGVSKREKTLLMFLRVFNHIVYAVIPNILEIIREERHFIEWSIRLTEPIPHSAVPVKMKRMSEKMRGLIREMTQLGVEGICASIQYIPLWAVEISQLPEKHQSDQEISSWANNRK